MFGLVSSVLAEKGRHVYTVEKTATVAEAVREMNEKGVGALLVMEGRRPAGIFTERDVLRRVVDADRTRRSCGWPNNDRHLVMIARTSASKRRWS
jgi:CBS domain-containing protein